VCGAHVAIERRTSLLLALTLMTSQSDRAYLLQMAQNSVLGTPTEFDTYGIITEAFILHKQPRDRYTIFPQLFIPWKPAAVADSRGSLPDFGLGRYYNVPPYIRLQGGVEVKKATQSMIDLPPPSILAEEEDIKNTLHVCQFQAIDQAKAAVKGGLLPNAKLLWLMFVGPYFTILNIGPFSNDQLITRTHKQNPSGDFRASLAIAWQKAAQPITRDLYLLGTPDAAAKLEFFITSTSVFLS